MVKKTILPRESLETNFGNKVLVFSNNFRLSDVASQLTREFPEIIFGRDAGGEVGNNYIPDAQMVVWEAKNLVQLGRTRRYLFIPKHTLKEIEVESMIDTATAVLEKHMPGRYFYSRTGQGFYLHYPEIQITNSLNIKHKIIDLVVFLPIRDDYFNSNIKGIRFAYTPAELNAGYAHSHMNGNNGLVDFCRGGGSPFDNLINSMQEGFSAAKFELFLFQLQSYLEWESVEGRPYKYLIEINEKSGYSPTNDVVSSIKTAYAREAINFIDPSLIILNYGVPFFDPGVNPEAYMKMEEKVTIAMMNKLSTFDFNRAFVDYDPEMRTYVRPADSHVLPSRVTEYFSEVTRAFNIQPRVLEPETKATRKTIKRPVPNLIEHSIVKISHILQQYNKLNE